MDMRAFRILFVLVLLPVFPLLAEMETSLVIRTAAFFHSSKTFRDVYGTASGCYELEGGIRFADCFEDWVNLNWFAKDGKTFELKQSTRVNIANVSFGMKYRYAIGSRTSVYLGLGPTIGRIWADHSFSGNHRKIGKMAYGVVVKSGIHYYFSQFAFADFFIDYLYQPVHFKENIDIGGLRTGVGAGMRF